MNDWDPEKKRTARARLAAEREWRTAREKLRRSLITGGAVVGVLGLAAVAGVLAAGAEGGRGSTAHRPVAAPSGATGRDRLAIPVGRPGARSTLTVWEDFRCPACKQFESDFGGTIRELVDKGRLRAEYHLVTLIDQNDGGSGSLRAANAAACAQQSGRFAPYHDVLYHEQPPESKDAYADDATLVRLAGTVHGLRTAAFTRCVRGGRYDGWVKRSEQAFQDEDLPGTPTVLLNGRNVLGDARHPLTPRKLAAMVERADRK